MNRYVTSPKLHVQAFENISVNVKPKRDQRHACICTRFCFAYANPHIKTSVVYPVAYGHASELYVTFHLRGWHQTLHSKKQHDFCWNWGM